VPKTLADGMLIVVEAGSTKFGLFVDELLSQQQVVIKSLEEHYKRVDGLSGATILWNGHIALIVDVFGLASQVNSNIREFRKTWFSNYPIDMNGLSVHLSEAE
jgi:two-component system chemotaxis sensor kinase CheA